MDIYKLKFTILQQEIFRFLGLNSGKNFTARSLARKLDVSPTAIAKSLPLLKKENLIVAEKDAESGRLSIGFNSGNERAVWMKRLENLNLVYSSGLVDFLSGKFPKAKIILTGLYANGLDTQDSEIEIVILGSGEKKVNLGKFEKEFDRKISLNFFKQGDSGIKNILLQGGVVLIGGGNEVA